MNTVVRNESVSDLMTRMGIAARRAAAMLATSDRAVRDTALRASASALRERQATILEANAEDCRAAERRGLGRALLDRLMLDHARIEAMATGLETVADMADPLGRVLADWTRPNGLRIQRVSVPLGVIGMIYESRPNVTADAAGLCLKSGNAVILRGGSESLRSNLAIHDSLVQGLDDAGIDRGAVQLVPTSDREAVGFLLSSMGAFIDIVVPRGGRSLIERVQREARVPVIGHLEGNCHVYLHESAVTDMAVAVTVNAKMRRTGICGAAETLLVDASGAARLLPPVLSALSEAGCEIRGDERVREQFPAALPAHEEDWSTEYLDAVIAVRVVEDLEAAVEHIRRYGSGHTESIIAEDRQAVEQFFAAVDSAILMHNASTQFADGGEFGMGAEIGIATGRIHARGPVGAEQLTSYKYIVRGAGQVRPG